MTALGNLFNNLMGKADVGGLDMQTLHKIRRELNNLQQQVSNLSVLMDSTGNLDPNLFLQHSRIFSVLPHECASLRFSTQEISSGTAYQTPTASDTSNAATWAYGMELDVSNATIKVTGIPDETILAFTCMWRFDPHATGMRALKWLDNSGNSVEDMIFDAQATYNNYLHVPHLRRVATADTYYSLQVWQNSGGGLDGDGILTVRRIR